MDKDYSNKPPDDPYSRQNFSIPKEEQSASETQKSAQEPPLQPVDVEKRVQNQQPKIPTCPKLNSNSRFVRKAELLKERARKIKTGEILSQHEVKKKKFKAALLKQTSSSSLGERKFMQKLEAAKIRKQVEMNSKTNPLRRRRTLSSLHIESSPGRELSQSLGFYTKQEAGEKLWMLVDPVRIESIPDEAVGRTNTICTYLNDLGFELHGVKADGNCFFAAFMGSYAHHPGGLSSEISQQSDPLQYLRNETANHQEDQGRAQQIRLAGEWITSDEGGCLAAVCNIPVRIVSTEGSGNAECHDSLILPNGDRFDVHMLQALPAQYLFLVDLGGHFVYATPRGLSPNVESLEAVSPMSLNNVISITPLIADENDRRTVERFNSILQHGILTAARRELLNLRSLDSADLKNDDEETQAPLDVLKVNVVMSELALDGAINQAANGAYSVILERYEDFLPVESEAPALSTQENAILDSYNLSPRERDLFTNEMLKNKTVVLSSSCKEVLEIRVRNSMIVACALPTLVTVDAQGDRNAQTVQDRQARLTEFMANARPNQCHEYGLSSIDPSSFTHIILPEHFKQYIDFFPVDKRELFVFVEMINQTVTYNRGHESFKVELRVPNFLNALSALYQQKKTNLILHAVRGFGPDDKD